MIVENPWEYSALLQQIRANFEPSERAEFVIIGLLISPRQQDLLRTMVNIFSALEAGETIERFPEQEKGG